MSIITKFAKSSLLALLCVYSTATAMEGEKIYIDADELNTQEDVFRIHIGNNIWIETQIVHRDITGLYTFSNSIINGTSNSVQADYKKTWKCPYCYRFWPVGTPCQNPECPSKYK